METYDVIIIGAGPAGLTAALYCARYKLKTLVLFKEMGGQMMLAHDIENYPGFKKISGKKLTENMKSQVDNLKVKIKKEEVLDISKEEYYMITTDSNKYKCHAIILALGTKYKKLNLKEEEKFIGRGLSYCVSCDAPLFKDKTVAIIGGSNSAIMACLVLEKYASKIYIIYRGGKIRAEPLRFEKIKKSKKIEIIYNAEIEKINGNNFIESIALSDGKEIKINGLFIEIGSVPMTYIIKKLNIETDDCGYILADKDMASNSKGVFAAGDCVSKKFRQIATAVNDGCIAAFSAYNYIKKEIKK